MQKIRKRYAECYSGAFQQLKITHNLVLCGLMAALAVVLNYTTSIFITPNIRIGFSGLPNRVVEYLFGPCIGAVFGGMLDILKYLLKPDGGAFFFGYTFNVMVAGIIYGTILYRRPVRLWRIFIAEFLTKAIVNCGLNTLWLAVMNGNAFLAILPARVIKNIIMLPIDTVILFFTLTFVSRLLMMPEFRKFRSGKF
ncbi:MAG: folate family ECF transporter S component [Lachnospiraceae bacterium]|jgi:ECF transporter S component (folate family)|nr:folate family ECF transporter S component [Lachnospiraceae bacterium]HBV81898.1 folate family ECF transporter S component [Lachnospiraceae bacterium]